MSEAFEELVVSSLTRIEDGQVRLTERMDGLSERTDGVSARMDKLVDTTNHRLDDFREEMTVLRGRVTAKAEKTELIVPVISRFLDSWPKRFTALVAGVVAASTLMALFWDFIHEFALSHL